MSVVSPPHSFPLAPFLVALSAEGVPVTVRDYERIGLVLRTGGPWTITRLRDALRALLAHDVDQRERFDSCFASFFDEQLAPDPALAGLDVARALADLAALARSEQPTPPPVPSTPEPVPPPVKPPPPPPQRRRWTC